MARISSFRESGERYPFLRALATLINAIGILLMILAALTLLAGVGATLVGLANQSFGGFAFGFLVAVIWSFGFFVAGVQCFALGSFFKLAIHIEENTRATAQALERLRTSIDPKPEVDPRSIFLS